MNQLNKIIGLVLVIVALTTSLGISIIFNKQESESEETDFYCGIIASDQVKTESIHHNHPGRILFEDNCAACHAIDIIVIGPALEGMSERNNEAWVRKMILDGHKLVEEGDPYAVKQYISYDSIYHPIYDFSGSELTVLIDYINKVSQENKTHATNTRQAVNPPIPGTKL